MLVPLLRRIIPARPTAPRIGRWLCLAAGLMASACALVRHPGPRPEPDDPTGYSVYRPAIHFDTLRLAQLLPGDTLLFSYLYDIHECLSVVRDSAGFRATRYYYRSQKLRHAAYYPDSTAAFYDRNRGNWDAVASAHVPVAQQSDSLRTYLERIYQYRTVWRSVEYQAYYLRLRGQRMYVRDGANKLRTMQQCYRLFGLPVPGAPTPHRQPKHQR